jgi:hypothetical protein
MIRKYFLASLMIVSCIINTHAQVPQKMNYQAVIRTSDNQLVVSRAVRMRISLMPDSMNATASYVETHQVTTNAFGIVQLEIGGGTVLTGTFAAIPWSRGKIFIKTETDPVGGTNYTLTSTTQMMSVPYALYASDVPVTKSGDTITIGKSRLIIPGSTLLPNSQASAGLSSGLVAFYPFNGNANDQSGNGNHGIVNGPVLTTDRFGKTNEAYNFQGGKIDVPHKSYLSIQQNGQFSISLWVYKTGTQNPVHIIGKRAQGAHIFNWQLGQHTTPGGAPGGGLFFTGSTNSTATGIDYNGINDSTIQINKWEHIVGNYSNGTWTLYKNGLLCGQKSEIIYAPDLGNPALEIGNCGGWGAFFGRIDDIRIYNRVLTQPEITYLATN